MKEKGFTLLELMIALAILAIGMLGTLGLLITAMHKNRYAYDYQLATQLLQKEAERIRSLNYENLPKVCNQPGCSGKPENNGGGDGSGEKWYQVGGIEEWKHCFYYDKKGEMEGRDCQNQPNSYYFSLISHISKDNYVPDLLKDVRLEISWKKKGNPHTLRLEFVVGKGTE